MTVAIPNEYLDQLLIITEPEWELVDGTILISVYEKQSYEESQKDMGEDVHMGFLFSIARYTQKQYEQFLGSDGSGQSFFARDDTYYYGYFTATDVQYYRSDGMIVTESDDWKAWEELYRMGGLVTTDMIARNGLTAYSDSEFFDREFTYNGEHLFVTYWPYYAVNGSKDSAYTLVLSQPVDQGEGGIWCVERWYDNNYGNLYYYFPNVDAPSAFDYYVQIQATATSPENTFRLDPILTAVQFAKDYFDHVTTTTDSFRRIDGEPAGNVLQLCNQVFDNMGTLQAASYVDGQIVVQEAYETPSYYDMQFSSYTSSNLYPIIWLKAGRPSTLTGNMVYCRNAEETKTLTFYEQDNLLCVNIDGIEQWFKPAYSYSRTPYDSMYGYYEDFSN